MIFLRVMKRFDSCLVPHAPSIVASRKYCWSRVLVQLSCFHIC